MTTWRCSGLKKFAKAGYAAAAVTLAFPQITLADPAILATNGHPFQALPLEDGLLVSVSANGKPDSVTGLRIFAGHSPTQVAMKCIQPIDAPVAFGFAVTPNGKGIVVAAGDAGLIFLDRKATIDGCHASAVALRMGKAGSRQGSLDVAISHDGRYAFVANEYGVAARDANGREIAGHVAVVALTYDDRGVPVGGTLNGRITTGASTIAGLALSPDGSRLYVTSEIAQAGARAANGRLQALAHGDCHQAGGSAQPFGLLTVVDVAKAEEGASNAIVSATAAGCSPVRAAVSTDGQTVWVTARGDDKVLAFSAPRLERDPEDAFLGDAPSGGEAPVGLTLYGGGKRLAVANSNRFAGAQAVGNLALLDVSQPTPTLITTIAAGHFPRSVTASSDGEMVFLTDFNGGRVQVFTVR